MALSPEQRTIIEQFRQRIEAGLAGDAEFGAIDRHDRQDESTLATRWAMDAHTWYELTVRPFLPQVRAAVMTDDRWRSEAFEQMIEDSGDTMQEFVELGFEAAGLDHRDPPVEHYRDQGRYFYFATPVDLTSLEQLADTELSDRVVKMLRGYHLAFSGRTA